MELYQPTYDSSEKTDESDPRERVNQYREVLEAYVEEGGPGDWVVEAVLQSVEEDSS